MAGTSIIFADANPSQADVIATLWTPEGIAPQLIAEMLLGGTAAASIINHAAPSAPASLINNPTFNSRSMAVVVGTSAGVDTKSVPNETDQTYVIVCRTPTQSSGIFAAAAPFTGILYGVSAGKWGFYNSQGGAGTTVAEAAPVAGGNYQFVIGYGTQGGPGNIQTGTGGVLNALATGTANGGARPTTPALIGGNVYGNPGFEIAFAARLPAILNEAQRLAWYQTLRGDGTAAGATVGPDGSRSGGSPLGLAVL